MTNTTQAPTIAPAVADRMAKEAEAKAKAAIAAADNARRAAKSAARAASKAKADAEDLRLQADPARRERANLSTDQAKARLLDAAKAFDPLKSAREGIHRHPFILVGAAAGAGAVLASSGGALLGLSALTSSLFKLARPLAMAAAQFAAAKVAAHQAAETTAEQVRQPDVQPPVSSVADPMPTTANEL